MNPNEIPQQVRERIRKEAEEYADAEHFHNIYGRIGPAYISGAESEWLLSQQQWISVEERLPEAHEHVLVTASNSARLEIAIMGVGGRWIGEGGGYLNVTHWRKLPPPPQNK